MCWATIASHLCTNGSTDVPTKLRQSSFKCGQSSTHSSHHLTPFSSPLRFLCWLSRFCCSSSGTSSLLSKWCTLNSRKTKTKRKSCELLRGALAAVPLPAAGAGVGTDPAEPQLHDGRARKDSPVPVFGEGHGLCGTGSAAQARC